MITLGADLYEMAVVPGLSLVIGHFHGTRDCQDTVYTSENKTGRHTVHWIVSLHRALGHMLRVVNFLPG